MKIPASRNPNEPHCYPKRILLLVVGMAPQIVTETLYKLAVDNKQPFIPHEIHLITTQQGADLAKKSLLGTTETTGHFYRLCLDYQLPDIAFNEQHIHIIEDTEGNFIDDSESTKHNRIASDFITQTIKNFTYDDDTALHVSLAGGRKTMSFYMGYALSLYGRVQDNLSHTLVNNEFMNDRDFFYPRPNNDAHQEANIILSDIPYVRMSCQVPKALLEGDVGFQETVNKIQHFNAPATIKLYRGNSHIVLNGLVVKLSKREFAFYYFFYLRQRDNKPPLVLDKEDFLTDFLHILQHFISRTSASYAALDDKNAATKYGQADTPTTLQKKRSVRHKVYSDEQGKLHTKIRKEFGDWASLARPFEIQQIAMADQKIAYQLNVPIERIDYSKEKYQQ